MFNSNLPTYEDLITDIKNNISKLDKTKTKVENKLYLNNIEATGKELFEALVFKLISKGDYFFGNFAIQMERKSDCLLKAPAAIWYDGYRYFIGINPIMFVEYTQEQQLAITIHEFYHCINEHIFRGKNWQGKAKHEWINIAMDGSINQYISGLPQDCVTLKSMSEMIGGKQLEKEREFEYYLEQILEYIKEIKDQEENADDPDQDCNGGGGKQDDQEQKNEGQGGSDSSGEGDEDSDGGSGNEEKDPEERGFRDSNDNGRSDHEWEESQEKSEDLAKELLKQMANEAYNDAKSKGMGNMPGGVESMIQKLNTQPEIKWETVFKRMLGSIPWGSTWSPIKPHRIHPLSWAHSGKTAARTVDVYILRDVSGSMMGELEAVSNEIYGMLANTPARVTLIDWDTGITDIKILREVKGTNKGNKKKQEADISKFKGAGGTDPAEAIAYFNSLKKPNSVCVFLTDMYIPNDTPKINCKNILWIGSPDSDRNFSPRQGIVKFLKPHSERK